MLRRVTAALAVTTALLLATVGLPAPATAAAVDLSVSVSGSVEVIAGTPIGYTIVVANSGDAQAQDVLLEDVFPTSVNGIAITSADSSCTSFPCLLPTVPAGGSVTFTVTATVNEGFTAATLTNQAKISWPTVGPDQVGGEATDTSNTTVNLLADLAVTATPDRTSVRVGESVTWTVVVTNNGPSRAASALVFLPLPAGMTPAGLTSSSNVSCDVPGVCTIALLPTGDQETITLSGTVPSTYAGSSVSLVVQVDDTVRDTVPDLADSTATSAVGVVALADLTVTNHGPVTAVAGTSPTWTIEVTNDGPSTALDVVVADQVPAGLSITGVSGAGCSALPCTLASLASGATATITVVGAIAPGYAASTLSTTATIDSPTVEPGADPDAGRSSTANTVITTSADLRIGKDGVGGPFVAGGTATWDVVVTNDGPSTARDVSIAEALPAGVSGLALTGPAGVTCPAAGPCTVAAIAPGAGNAVTIRVTGTLAADHSAGSVSNTASVTSTTADPETADNAATEVVAVVTSADLTITNDGPTGAVVAGEPISWTVSVSNGGPSVARNVVVADPVPAGVTGVSVTSADTSCTAVPCALGDLVPGGVATLTISGTVAPSYDGAAITTTATVTSDTPDPVALDNLATDVTAVETSADLSILKTVDQDAAVPGETVSYTIAVDNAGPSTATDLVVTDTLPATLIGASATTSLGSCDPPSGGVLTCSAAGLDPGEDLVVTVTGTLDPEADQGTVTNSAAVASSTPDPDLANNSSVAVVGTAPADLSVTKTADVAEVAPEASITWTVVVGNGGPARARGVVLTDQLPDGVDITAVEPSQGTCGAPGAGEDLVCALGTIADGAEVSVVITGTVGETVQGSLTNAVSVVSPDEGDPSDNAAQVTTPVTVAADLRLTTVAAAPTAVAGRTVEWTVSVTNRGPAAATGVTVTDVLPSGLADVTVSDTGCAVADGVVTCLVGDLEVGGERSFTISAMVAPSRRGSLVNAAAVSSSVVDVRPGNNAAEADVQVEAVVDLAVTKVAADETVSAGDSTDYTILVSNAGPSAALGVTVEEHLPAGATVLASSSDDFDADTALWSPGQVDPGSSELLRLEVRLERPGTAVNRVRAGSAEGPGGPVAEAAVEVLAPAAPPIDDVDADAETSLPDTGFRDEGLLRIALLLLVAGATVLGLGRRRGALG